MFKISPIQNKQLQAKYAEDCEVEFYSEAFAYSMIDNETEELIGMSQFDITEEYGYIYTLCSKKGVTDFEAMFILGRATMNFIDTCGNSICRASAYAGEEKLLKAIGFVKGENEEYIADMKNMFNGHCNGKAVEL